MTFKGGRLGGIEFLPAERSLNRQGQNSSFLDEKVRTSHCFSHDHIQFVSSPCSCIHTTLVFN